jgi:hypothetical protein
LGVRTAYRGDFVTPGKAPLATPRCEHGFLPGNCPEDGCLYRREVKNALLGLAGSVAAASDQAEAMTDAELGERLTTGRWSTIEVHEAGWRLMQRG